MSVPDPGTCLAAFTVSDARTLLHEPVVLRPDPDAGARVGMFIMRVVGEMLRT